jgi:hypothetical protein
LRLKLKLKLKLKIEILNKTEIEICKREKIGIANKIGLKRKKKKSGRLL